MAAFEWTGPEQDALTDWTNNAEGDLRRLLQEYDAKRGGLERLLAVLDVQDPDKSLTAFLQRQVPLWIAERLALGYCENCEVTGHVYHSDGEDC